MTRSETILTWTQRQWQRLTGWPRRLRRHQPIRDVMVLRLRTLLANARGDDAAYRELRERYRKMANCLAMKDIWCGPRRCDDRRRVSRPPCPRVVPDIPRTTEPCAP